MVLTVGCVPEHFSLPFHAAAAAAQKPEQDGHGGTRPENEAENELNVVEMPRGTGSMTLALRGLSTSASVDAVVALSEGLAADLSTKGNEAYRVVAAYTASPLEWGIAVSVARQDGDIKAVSDLEGGVFGVSRLGSGSHLMAALLAHREGWKEAPQFKVIGGMAELVAALQDGSIDAFLWETAMLSARHDVVWQVGSIVTPWPCFLWAARTEVLRNPAKRQVLLNTIGRVRAAAAKFVSDEKAALAEIDRSCSVEPAAGVKWLSTVEFTQGSDVPGERAELVKLLGGCLDTLRSVGILTASADADAAGQPPMAAEDMVADWDELEREA
jgi:Ca3427-like PBP